MASENGPYPPIRIILPVPNIGTTHNFFRPNG